MKLDNFIRAFLCKECDVPAEVFFRELDWVLHCTDCGAEEDIDAKDLG